MSLWIQLHVTFAQQVYLAFLNSYKDSCKCIGLQLFRAILYMMTRSWLAYINGLFTCLAFWCAYGSLSLIKAHAHAVHSIAHGKFFYAMHKLPARQSIFVGKSNDKIKIIVVHRLSFYTGKSHHFIYRAAYWMIKYVFEYRNSPCGFIVLLKLMTVLVFYQDDRYMHQFKYPYSLNMTEQFDLPVYSISWIPTGLWLFSYHTIITCSFDWEFLSSVLFYYLHKIAFYLKSQSIRLLKISSGLCQFYSHFPGVHFTCFHTTIFDYTDNNLSVKSLTYFPPDICIPPCFSFHYCLMSTILLT